MIIEWQPSPDLHNLGDHLAALIPSIYTKRSRHYIQRNDSEAYILVGSVIADWNIDNATKEGKKLGLLACGYRGTEISAELASRVEFAGCRGPLTSAALERAGVPDIRVVGDTASLLPLVLRGVPERSGQSLLVPHILDPRRHEYRAVDFGCSSILSPATSDLQDLISKIGDISSARFVLSGSMHAAIIAQVYNVPFAFFAAGYCDCPAKWADWALSIGLREGDVVFHSHLDSGIKWHQSVCGRIHHRPLLPLIREAAKLGTVRPSIWMSAILSDIKKRLGHLFGLSRT